MGLVTVYPEKLVLVHLGHDGQRPLFLSRTPLNSCVSISSAHAELRTRSSKAAHSVVTSSARQQLTIAVLEAHTVEEIKQISSAANRPRFRCVVFKSRVVILTVWPRSVGCNKRNLLEINSTPRVRAPRGPAAGKLPYVVRHHEHGVGTKHELT
jgi:hypothetical protein